MSGRYSIDKENVRWRIVGGEAVVINLLNTYYYSLNRTGTFLWNLLLEQDRNLEEIIGQFAGRYERPPAEIAADVSSLLDALVREQLIQSIEPASREPRQ